MKTTSVSPINKSMSSNAALSAPLFAMTGFGQANGQLGPLTWAWEARSVNGRGLDLRIKLPSGFQSLELKIRKAFSAAFTRGNIQISLQLVRASDVTGYRIDRKLLDILINTANKGQTSAALVPGHISELLQVPGVVIQEDLISGVNTDDLHAALFESVNGLIENLKQARASEGEALSSIFTQIIGEMSAHIDTAKRSSATSIDVIKENYNNKFQLLMGQNLSEDRLVQEAALLALKVDIREELDRLDAHVTQANNLLNQGSPIGRKLDFLSQEFNREVNTLCSKSSDIDLTRTGLELKAVIEQFREQAANVE